MAEAPQLCPMCAGPLQGPAPEPEPVQEPETPNLLNEKHGVTPSNITEALYDTIDVVITHYGVDAATVEKCFSDALGLYLAQHP